jgi:hypothetical protein
MISAGHGGQALDADVAQPAGADDHDPRARVEERHGLAYRVVGGQARVGQRRDVRRPQRGIQLDHGSGGGEQQVGHAAVGVDAGELRGRAVHVVAGAAGPAQAARDEGVQDDRVSGPDAGHGRADLAHPAGVLVPDRVRQGHTRFFGPLAFDDVQIRAAQPGAADLDQHIQRAADRGLGDVLDDRTFVVLVQAYRSHRHSLSDRWVVARWLVRPPRRVNARWLMKG